MNILRLEPLGDHSDTLLCLIDGDAHSIQIHEAPEHLHYGIDTYDYDSTSKKIIANKYIRTFTKSGDTISLTGEGEHLDLAPCFRSESPRVLKMTKLAELIAKANNVTHIDSAEMGFEMTQGVGMVSFDRQTS